MRKKRLLIVEDCLEILEALILLFEMEGFDILTALNGAEALEILNEGELPNAILLDLQMPVMDGREFLRECSKWPVLAQIPVIVFSADRADKFPTKVAQVFRKPLEIDRLRAAVNKLVSSWSSDVSGQ